MDPRFESLGSSVRVSRASGSAQGYNGLYGLVKTGLGRDALQGSGGSDNSGRPDVMQTDALGAALMLRQHFSELAEAFGSKWKTMLPVLTKLEEAYRVQMMRWIGSPVALAEMRS